jgi:hypothetical protein
MMEGASYEYCERQRDMQTVQTSAPPSIWLQTLPVISTAHLDQSTARLLEGIGDDNPWVNCARYEFGFFLSVPTDECDEGDGESCYVGMPSDLESVLKWARKKGYDWIRLDACGDVVEELHIFDW